MRTHAVSVGTLLLVFNQLVIIESQRIREGRCPVVQRRNDCPEVVWDACTCDLDCQGIKKCCLDGCNYACLYPDFGTPSVRNNADVVFIMDSSGSIGKLDYKREKQFVKDLTNVFEVAPNATRVSTIIYSDYPKLIFDFNTYSDKRSIIVAQDNLEYLGNRTRIDRALDKALVVFSESRPSVPRIAFVLTDGEQTEENDAKPLDVAVRPLHDLGVQVYVIGIGSYIKREELYLLARRRQDVFFVSSFEKLLRQTYRIVNQIDTVQDLIPPLQITADMLFLLDSSSAVPRLNYPKELEFLKKVVDLFRISPRYVRAGVIPYGVRAELSIPLGRHSTNEAINRSIDLLPYIGGQRRIERALILANQTFSEARPLVPKILLILTHGGALTIPGANLLTAVQALRFQGVSMFVISFGEDVNYATLGQIVQTKNLITDKSYDALEPYLPFAASYIRVNSDFTTPLDRNAAVVFLIDSTFDSVDKNDFKRQREFVISLAKAFKIPNNGTRVSVVTYGKDARPIVQFKDSGNFDSFLYAMMSGSSRMQGPRRMDRALRLAVRMFKDHLKPGPRAVVLFTSGPQDMNTSLSFLERPIKQLANLGARIHVVAIGSKVPYSQVSRLVNSSDDVFQISSFVRLQYEIHAIGRHISLTKGPRPPFIADIVFLVDSSGGIGSNNYKKQKEFVKTIAKALNLGEQYSRACLVVYSDGPRLVTNFNSHKTLREFGSALDRAPYLNRIRRIDKALEFGADLLRRARRDIPKVAILITSGARDSSNSLDVASNPLEALGAKSFIVAIGNAPDIRELRLVVAKNDDIFRVSSFRSLPGIEESFPKHIISSFLYSYGPEPEPEELDDLDVIFLMDSSQPISFQAYRRQKTFIKSMVKHFNVSPGKSRVALVTYGSSASAEYLFGDTMFDQFVDGARFVGGVRRVDLAMQEAARLLSSTRQLVQKPVILLTGGNQEGGLSPDVAARMVRTRGGRPFVIMISREPDEAEFLKVVETSNHLFRVPSFERMELYAASLAKRIRGYVKEDPGPVPVPNYIADIVFVLDSSTGVSFSDYKKQIDFVKLLAQDLSISSRYSNAALVVYGEMAEEVLSFDTNRSLSDFETAIDNSPYLRGERRIDRALNETVRIMANARPSETKVVVLLTAGKQTSQSGGQSPGEAALPLLKNSVYNYVVAVGQEPDIAQLRPVVQDLSHIFRMASYDDLESQEPLVAHVIIDTSTSPKPITDIVSDIIFIMDSSSDVTREDYVRQKGFVKDIARYLKISAGRGARAAVITYGRNSSLLIKFGGYGTLLSFDEAVDSAPFVGGRRRMDLALKDAELLLSEARPDEAKWVILLTAGRQSTPTGVKTLEEASRSVREKSDKVYVVTIGNKMDIRKIQDVVSDPKDIFSVPSAEGLKSQTRLIANAIVKGHNDSDFRVVKTFKADIVFLVDTSSSVESLHFRSQKQFVKSMAKSLNVAPGKSRAAIVTYGASSDRSDMHASLSTFEEAVDSSRYIRGRRRTHLAVNDADSLLQASRPDAQKVVVLLSGGRESSSQDIATLKQSFRTLRASGTKIFVIAIGSNYNEEDFFPAVERFEDIFTVSSFDTLVSQAWLTSKSIAERTDLLVPRSFQADILFIMDSSADVSREDYEKEKDFVVTLAKYLRLSPGGTRAGLLTYGYTPTLIANYDSYDRLEMFKNATYKAPYIGGSRRIDETFYSASQLIPSARKLLPKIIIFLAAGKQEIGYSFDLEASKRKLQNHGAKMYLVAIGDGPSSDELYPVVKEKYVHRVPSFDYLQRNALAIAQEVGKQEDPKIPENFVGGDVVLIVDSSSDVSPFEFEKEKEFVKALTGAMNAPSSSVRSALIAYGNRAQVMYNLNNEMNITELHRAIDSVEAIGGERRMDRALEEGVRLLRNAADRSTPKIMLLITAGSHVQEEGAQSLSSYGADLEALDANPFVLAIGGKARKQELEPVVKDSEDVFAVKSFEGLPLILGRLAFYIAQRTLDNTVPGLDVVFVMDSSSGVTTSNYANQKEAVKAMARSLNVPSGKSRAAVITYGNRSSLVITFNGYRTFSVLEGSIDLAPIIGGRRRLDRALVRAGIVMSAARSSFRKIVVLITSGKTGPSSIDLYTSAKGIFQHNAELFIFAIGKTTYGPELFAVVTKQEHVFSLPSFTDLKRESKDAIRSLVRRPSPETYGNFTADLIFLVDSSSSVNRQLFDRQKAFVKSMVQSLDFSPEKSRVAVISYGSRPNIGRFSSSANKDTISSGVDNLRYVSGRRNISKALGESSSLLEKARESVSKVLVLLTTGSEPSLTGPSQILKERGVKSFVIAVGAAVDKEELNPVVDDPRDIFSVATPLELTWRSHSIVDEIAKRAISYLKGDFKADIVFLVDSSSGVTEDSFDREKTFISRLSEGLNLSPRNSRVAVVLYAKYPRLAVRLGILQTPESLQAILEGLSRIDGNRRMDKALEMASTVFDNSRSGVRQIVVVLTAGPQYEGSKPLIRAVERLRAIDVEIYVIAIGTQVNKSEVTPVVNRKEDILEVASFQLLSSNVKPIRDHIITALQKTTASVTPTSTITMSTSTSTPSPTPTPTPTALQKTTASVTPTSTITMSTSTPSPTPTPTPTGKTERPLEILADIVFVVDSSLEVDMQNYDMEKDFVKSLAKNLNLNPDKSRASVVIYSNVASTVIKFDDYSNSTIFDTAVDSQPYLGSVRKMDLGLLEAATVLKNARSGVPKVVILLTAGRQSSPTSSLAKAVNPLVKLKAKLFIVAITSRIDERELLSLVDNSSDILKVPNFENLAGRSWPIANYIVNNTDKNPVNVIFLVDTSIAIAPRDLAKEKNFVKSLIRAFQIPLMNSKMAVLPYGSSTVSSKKLIGYRSLNEFDEEVDSLQLLSGSRRMDVALTTAKDLLQQEKSPGRHIIVLLTAGRQALGYRGEQLKDSGKAAKEAGAEVYIVAIGSEPSGEELRPSVTDFQNIYQVGSIEFLKREALPIGKDIIRAGKVRPVDVTADIVFMMDSSSSVSEENFEKEKEFIKYLARLVNITSGKSRVAVIIYSGTTMLAVRFDGYNTFDEFEYSVDEIPLIGGPYRRMDLALQSAARVFNSARKNVSKIAVLLTTGRQIPSGTSLTSAFKQLRSFDADSLVVAIGQQYNKQELSTAVSSPDDLFEVLSFDVLSSYAKNLGEAIADKSAPKPEDIMADVVFLIDSSSSVTSINFQLEKKFVKSLARTLNVGSEKSRGSIIVYGSKNEVAISLEEFTDLHDFKLAVESANYMDGSRRMDLALQNAAAIMRSARRNVSKVAILLTAGKQSPNASDLLSSAVGPLRDLGVHTFVVAIGSDPNKRELDTVVEDPRNVFYASSFEDLSSKTIEIPRPIAERSKQQQIEVDADIVFLVDSSSFVTQTNLVKEKQFVKSLAKLLNVSSESSRAAVVFFGSSLNTEIRFGDYRTLDGFNIRLDQGRAIGGSRRIDLALGETSKILAGGRRGVPYIVILVTSGRDSSSLDNVSVEVAMESLENLGAHNFVVAIAHDPENTSADVLPVNSFDDLPLRVYDIARYIKKASEPKPANLNVDIVFLIDSSNAVGTDGFNKEKSFVKSMAKYMNVSPGKSRASVVSYYSSTRTILNFTDFQAATDFSQKMDREPWRGGARRIDLALDAASTLVAQARSNVQKIVVLVTSGKQSVGFGDTPLESHAQRLKDMGATILIVTVGREADYTAFIPLVDSAGDIFGVPLFSDLRFEVQPIIKHVIQYFGPPVFDVMTEVVFILDASTNVGRQNFEKQKAVVKQLARLFDVGPEKSRAALVTYSTYPFTVIPLGNYTLLREFERTLDDISFYGGQRRMDRALEEAVDLFKEARPDVQRKVIMFTAGRQTPSDDEQTLDEIKKMLLEAGALPFIFAVGKDHDFSSLTTAVEYPQDLFKIPAFDDLLPQLQAAAKKMAIRTKTPIIAEYIVFLLDSSSAVRPDHFKKEKDFIKDLAKSLYVGVVEKTWAAVVNYGSFPFSSISFYDYSTLAEFESALDRITPAEGTRRIDRAIDEAASIFNSTDPYSSKILVLLTTGRQAQESDVTPFDVGIQPLLDMGTHTYVIAIGSDPSARELRPLVANPEDLFQILFNMLQSQVSRVVKYIRTDHPRPAPVYNFVFLIDSSSDVTNQEFSQEILFVKALARELNSSIPKFHAAVISFGNRNSIAISFGSYSSLRDFYTAVDSTTYQGGARRMDKGLDTAHAILSSLEERSQKAVVLITGGRNSKDAGPSSLQSSVRKLQEMGASVVFVAFGNRYNVQELLPVVRQSKDIHPVPGANDLLAYVSSVATYITLSRPDPVHATLLDTDVLFVLDSSYEVSQNDFKIQKDFVKSILRNLDIAPDGSRAAAITYGDQASYASRFIDLQSFEDFDKAVDDASYVGGERRIDRALRMGNRLLKEAKEESSKVVIFLTGGRQASTGESLLDITEPMRMAGVKTVVVAVGKKTDTKELRPLVVVPQDVLSVKSFENLQSQTKQVSGHISERAGTLRPDSPVDVVFLVDSSDGVNPISYNKEKAFVKIMAKRLNISPDKSRAAVVAYGSNSRLEIGLDDNNDLPTFNSIMDSMASLGGPRRIDKALEIAANVLNDSRISRPKIVVLLTSGRQPLDAPTLSVSAGKLHTLGAMVFVVSIANDVDPKYFDVLVEDSGLVSIVPSFDGLSNALSKLILEIEQGITSRMILNVDIVFLMDASTAGSPEYFQSQKVLIKSIMKNVATTPDNVRASLILYSSSAYLISDLKSYTTRRKFENEVEKAKYRKGSRRIDRALAAAGQQMSQSRPSAAKIVVLITTGPQGEASDITPLDRASQPLRDANANILVVGIGKNPDVRELYQITKNPQDVQIISSPSEVVTNVHLFSRQLRIRANKGIQPTHIPRAELIFLLDSSSGVTPTVFKQQKNFIKFIVGHFSIGPNKTRAAVVRYSSSASSVINFNSFDNLPDLLDGIENIQYLSGGRRIDAALKEADNLRKTARSNVPIYVIILTAGRQVVVPGSTPLGTAAKPLLDSKARLIVVGIGSQPDERELRSMARRDEEVFRIPPSELQLRAPFFVLYMASHEVMTSGDLKADILFMVDSSQTISNEKFQRELDFVKAIVRTLNISPERSRASVVSFGNTPSRPSIRFEDYTDIDSFVRGVDNVPYTGGQKHLDKALLFAGRVLSKSRPDAYKLLVVITDGKQPLGEVSLSEAVRPLHELGVILYVIAAGENADMKELGKITSTPDNLFYSKTFDVLVRQVPVVYEQIVSLRPLPQPRHGLFLVDSSGLRSTDEFAAQIDFIKAIAKRLDVSPNGTRTGIVLYNSPPQLAVGLDEYKTVPDLYALLDGLSRQGGRRELHKALTLAGETLHKSAKVIPKFLLILAEGQQYGANGAALLRDAVRPLQTLGVIVYVVAIGNRLNRQELESVVQNSEHIVSVSDFTQLLQEVGSISSLIDSTVSVPCKGALDVGFVVDASGSIGLDIFSRNKNFVKLMSRKIADSSSETRLGLIAFSDAPTLFVDFTDFEQMTMDTFQTIADELPFHGGRSRIDLALQAASTDLFTNKRSGVPRVLILVSDGRQSKDPGYIPLSRAVKPLQGQRVKVLAVAFGDGVNTKDLEIVTGSINNIFAEKDYADIDALQREVESKACKI